MSLTDSIDSAHDTVKDILSAVRNLEELLSGAGDSLSSMSEHLGGLDGAARDGGGAASDAAGGGAAAGRGGGPKAPSKAQASGLESALDSTAAKFAAMAMAAKVYGKVSPAFSAGAISASRGGTFSGGFASSMTDALGAVPFAGRKLGYEGAANIEERASGRAAQVVGQIEALGGSVSRKDTQDILAELVGQERRREDAYEMVRVEAERFAEDNPGAFGDRRRFQAKGFWANQHGLFTPELWSDVGKVLVDLFK